MMAAVAVAVAEGEGEGEGADSYIQNNGRVLLRNSHTLQVLDFDRIQAYFRCPRARREVQRVGGNITWYDFC